MARRQPRELATEAAAGAGDDGHLVFEIIHVDEDNAAVSFACPLSSKAAETAGFGRASKASPGGGHDRLFV
jgi:hypothetical protein